MFTQEIESLLRLERSGDQTAAALASAILDLIAMLKDAQRRAALAEAISEAEKAVIADARRLTRQLGLEQDETRRAEIYGRLTEVLKDRSHDAEGACPPPDQAARHPLRVARSARRPDPNDADARSS